MATYSIAHEDPLLKILQLEEENFRLQHANLTASEQSALWNQRSKQLRSILDIDPPFAGSAGTQYDEMVCCPLQPKLIFH